MSEFVAPVFTEFIWMLAGGLLGALLALYLLFQTSRNERLPPLAWSLPLLLLELSFVAGGLGGLANADLWTGTMAALQMRFLGCFVVLPFAGTWLLGLAFLAARESPRDVRTAAAVLVLVLLCAIATVVEGFVGGNPLFGWVRGGFYVGIGSLVAVAALGTGRERGAGWAAQIAALAFPFVVVAIEAGEWALVRVMAMRHAARVEDATARVAALPRMIGRVSEEAPYGLAAVGLAVVVPLVVAGVHQLRGGERAELLGLVGLLAVPAVYALGLPGLDAMAAAIEAHLAP